MDQIKPILAALNTHRFWVGCGVTAIALVVVWLLGFLSLTGQASDWAGEIKSKQSTVQGIKGIAVADDEPNVTAFPNDDVAEGMQELVTTGRLAVAEAWQEQHAKQSALFVWPSALPAEAREAFRKLRPIEKMLPFPTPREKEVNLEWRQSYRDYIAERLPELAEKIGARWIGSEGRPAGGNPYGGGSGGGGGDKGGDYPGSGAGLGAGGGTGVGPGGGRGGRGGRGGNFGPGRGGSSDEEDLPPPIVVWDDKNQQLWLDKTTQFTGKNGNTSENNTPLTIQVMYAQEDLWILEAIFDVIKATNGEADAYDLAAIKQIDHIFVGIDATGSVGSVGTPAAGGGGQRGMGMGGRDGGYPDVGGAAGGTGGGGGNPYGGGGSPYGGGGGGSSDGGGDASLDPAHNRYVDKDYKSLQATAIRGAFTAPTPDNAYLAVAKRVPVRIGMEMDERAVFEFLANCANSKPTLEVRQVRINRHEPGEIGAGAAAGAGVAGSGGAGRSRGGSGSPERPGAGGAAGSAGGAGASLPGLGAGGDRGGNPYGGGGLAPGIRSDYRVKVEIYGIVHVFNPVDEKRVEPLPGTEAAESTNPAAPGGQPVTTRESQPANNRRQAG